MIHDATHLQVLFDMAQEVQVLISHFNARESGLQDRVQLCDLRIQRNRELIMKLEDQIRALDWMAGRPIEPVAHEATAVLVGIGEVLTP
jgi:hypothetical protein